MKKTLTIGIAGGTGSGKSTVAAIVRDQFKRDAAILRCDDYYKAQHELTLEERCKVNYDHPDSIDFPLMIEHVKTLQQGNAVMCPIYDFTVHDRSSETKRIEPGRVLIIDGILVLAVPELRELLDIKIYVDTDADVRILRRIRRDVRQRGRTLDSVIDQYITTVKPMHDAYVEPSKRYADLIIPEGGRNTVAMDLLRSCVKSHLE
ncbi:MAG: uridine kinase [Clostridia bacterium]|nr:uridine kinase [Clostridia bacterium]